MAYSDTPEPSPLTKDQAEQLSANGHILKPVCERWLRLLSAADKQKRDRFTKLAEESSKFFDGNHDWMWKEEYALNSQSGGFLKEDAGDTLPSFRMTVNRVFEAVALFGPALYHQNPKVTVSTQQTPDIAPESLGLDQSPFGMQQLEQLMMQEQMRDLTMGTHASIMESYLNWLQHESDKKVQARRAINEAIIKGMSMLWTEVYRPPSSSIRYPRSVYVSVDDLQIDPDARYWEDVQWVARRRVLPVNQVEERYGLPQGVLQGSMRSKLSQTSDDRPKGPVDTTLEQTGLTGRSHDLLEFWEIYSKNGFGDQLRRDQNNAPHTRIDFTAFGPYTYLAVAPSIPYPLNLPTWDLQMKEFDEIFEQVQWPIPFWADPNCDGGWPFSRIFFYESPDHVWPISLFKPAIGELRFINWCMSFLADKVAQACTTYIGVLKEAGAEIQKQLNGKQTPYTVVEIANITGRGKLSEVIEFLQAPSFPVDIWQMASEVMNLIDKRTGLTELVYGMSTRQLRSAEEASIKDAATNIRPDDMASKTEDFLSNTASKEMQAARWLLEGPEVQHVLGEAGTFIWDNQIRTEDFDILVRDFQFRIEAGSARKPNKAGRAQRLAEIGQVIMPMVQDLAMAGNVGPWNAYVSDLAKNLDLNPDPYLLEPPPPPEEQGPSPEEQQAMLKQQEKEMDLQVKSAQNQMELKRQQLELAFKEMTHEQELDHDDERHELEMDHLDEKGELEIQTARRRAASSNGSKK